MEHLSVNMNTSKEWRSDEKVMTYFPVLELTYYNDDTNDTIVT